MDDGEGELSVADSIIGTRQRRSNAGNRLKTLLQMQEPLEDEEQIFVEVEDDQEFDVNAADLDQEPENESENKGSDNDDDDEEVGEGDDDNFSDSSESEIENDQEAEDAGEQALLKQQKEDQKEKRRAEKRKMFEIKSRDPAPRPAKARKFVAKAESLLDSERRVSKRTLAIQNKERVIERLRENERRKAEYVSPVIKKDPKLTQEQRLEEAKITELKNTASLHHFVEIEEYRKQQQRLIWANRRPKLSNFIRYSSRSMLEYPGLIVDITEEVKEEKDTPAAPITPDASREGTPLKQNDENEGGAEEDGGTDKADIDANEQEPREPSSESSHADRTKSPSALTDEPSESQLRENGTAGDETAEPVDIDLAEPMPEEVLVKMEEELPDDATLLERQAKREEEPPQEEEEEELIREVEGPPTISTFNSITMHNFPDAAYNKHTVKGVYFGKQVLKSSSIPPKRICSITGNIAQYLDPSTGIAYYSLNTYRILTMIRNHEVAWSNELGGVYLGLRGGQRHASGVPDGFD